MNGKIYEVDHFKVYYSVPKKSLGAGILLIHEWWGLTDLVKKQADAFAEKGYDVVAVDLFNGGTTSDPKVAGEMMSSDDSKASLGKLSHTLHWMRKADGVVHATKVATIGYCFGGGYSFQCALKFADQINGSVVYYGAVPTDAAVLKNLKVPVLGIFAKSDDWITPEMVAGFKRAGQEAGADLQIYEYDAVHAFANPTNARHDAEAAADAEKKVEHFFHKVLGV